MEDDIQWKLTSDGRRPSMEDDLQWKTTSNGRQPPMEDDLQWKTTSNGRRPPMEEDFQWKTTSNRRRSQNIKSWIYQQQLFGSYSNFRPMLNHIFKCLKWRLPTMEDNFRCKDDLKACRIWLLISQGQIRGKLRGNLECDSAQPSLFMHILLYLIMIRLEDHWLNKLTLGELYLFICFDVFTCRTIWSGPCIYFASAEKPCLLDTWTLPYAVHTVLWILFCQSQSQLQLSWTKQKHSH